MHAAEHTVTGVERTPIRSLPASATNIEAGLDIALAALGLIQGLQNVFTTTLGWLSQGAQIVSLWAAALQQIGLNLADILAPIINPNG